MAVKPKGLLALASLAVLAIGVSAGTIFAADPPAQVAKPVANIQIVAVPANATNPNAIMVTLPNKAQSRVATGTTGLNNVPIKVPVLLQGTATDPKISVTKYAWTLSVPNGSKAALTSNNEAAVKFTPDVSGIYKVDLVVSNDAGSSPMASIQIHAGEYIGAGEGNCFQCHPQITDEWSKTPHATLFRDQINGGENPKLAEYGFGNEGCIRCHTTGFYPGMENGGFGDLWVKTGWQMPPAADVQAGKDNWAAVPVILQNMANIQCEDCHGPAKDHVTKGTPMPTSMDNGVCNVCHDGGGHHVKGTELRNAGHSDATSQAWTYPVGPSRQDCVRCHSGAGYVSFLKNPTEKATWDNSMQTVGCATCHDPHSDANSWQLRITGKPVEAAGITKDFGLSATCVECHNGRTQAADAQSGTFPHYSTAGEMLSDTGGVTYGQNVPNSAHAMVVGNLPMANPDPSSETVALFGRATPGPCVVCHMWPTPADAKDPNRFKVGEHSFNTVSPDGSFEYTAPCQPCHTGMKDFNLQAKADYDGNGKLEGVQNEVAGLLKLLQGAIAASGIQPIQGHPYFDQTNKAKWTAQQKNAIYNYLFVRGPEGADGKASAIHNFKRSVALLQLSYKDLTGKDVPNATLMK